VGNHARLHAQTFSFGIISTADKLELQGSSCLESLELYILQAAFVPLEYLFLKIPSLFRVSFHALDDFPIDTPRTLTGIDKTGIAKFHFTHNKQ
jgi:hypothetical protein